MPNKKKPSICALLSGPKMVLQCTTLCLPDADSVFLCGCHQNKENALPDLVAPLEVETPTSSQFQQASPVALELESQEEELGEYTSYFVSTCP